MKIQLTATLICLGSLILAGCATKVSSDRNAPTGPVSATVTLDERQAAYYGSAKGGKGTITFKGETHKFSIRGVGAGGTGLQKISATGAVYNLRSISDFPGVYTGLRTGFTVIKGKVTAKLENKNGVVLYLTGKAVGLASSTGADKFVIKMIDSPSGSAE